MYEITPKIYEKTAQKVSDAVGNTGYFSGTIDFSYENVECRMLLSMVIYRKKVEMPEGRCNIIDDVVPVWWEFHTTVDGEELINDFDFSLFKEYIL